MVQVNYRFMIQDFNGYSGKRVELNDGQTTLHFYHN